MLESDSQLLLTNDLTVLCVYNDLRILYLSRDEHGKLTQPGKKLCEDKAEITLSRKEDSLSKWKDGYVFFSLWRKSIKVHTA